jgi:hypothetical protein
MSNTSAVVILLLLTLTSAESGQKKAKGIQLPSGYTLHKGVGVDVAVWRIQGANSFVIDFEAGPTQRPWPDPKDIGKYSWYREQIVRGYTVRYALIKPGVKTQWEPDDSRGLPPGQIVLVSYFLSGKDSPDTANFRAKIANMSELADVLIIANSLDPKAAGL